VTFTGNDATSGISTCTPAATLATEGASQSASGTCANGAGLMSSVTTAGGINIDLTPPAVSISSPTNTATYARNSVVTAAFSCSDVLSGLASANACVGTVANGTAIHTSTRGLKTFRVTGRDAAGNTTRTTYSYTVQ
jgi:hypothetical protein